MRKLPVTAQCSPAVMDMHGDEVLEHTQRKPGPHALSAGCPGATYKPALLQLDPDALNRVFAKLEPEALALAGAHEHSACLYVK